MNTPSINNIGTLCLVKNSGGWRHLLCGRDVRCGSGLLVLVQEKPEIWAPCCYECNLSARQPVPDIVLDGGHLTPFDSTRFAWPK